jgi:predicted RNase H-like nuclease (RuvC/YqgF family)
MAAHEAEAERARAEVSRLTDELVRRTATLEAAEQQLAAEREPLTDGPRDSRQVAEAEKSEPLDDRDREPAAQAASLDERDRDLAAQTAALDERRSSLEQEERRLGERQQQLARSETGIAAREAEVLRLQAGLAAQQESLRARERALEDAERVQEREQGRPAVPYVSFAEGLDAFSATRRRD